MTTRDDRVITPIPAETEPEAVAAAWAGGPGHAFPATAAGVPLSACAFAFAVGVLGLVDTGILPGAASGMFIATALGIGAGGLLVGGLWEFRRHPAELHHRQRSAAVVAAARVGGMT